MKKVVLVLVLASLLGACGFIPTPSLSAATESVASPTSAPTETETPLPTLTSVPATEPFTSTPETLLNPTITPIPIESLVTAQETATVGAITATPTAVSFPSSVTPTPTNGILTYGTLPPAVPSNIITLWNRSKTEAYISLQQQDGQGAILEYPVRGRVFVDVPLGTYIYVAWVGGKKMTGSFRVGASDDITIILYKDRIVVEKS